MKRVYFIKPVGMDGPVKIGCSEAPNKRRDALRVWCPFPLEIVGEIKGDGDLERRFHALFYDDWQGSEWFKASPQLTEVVAAVAAGTFDVATLPAPRLLPRNRKALARRSPEERALWSLRARCSSKFTRSGFYIGHSITALFKEGRVAEIEEYLKAPEIHGHPCVTEECRKRQRAWIASRALKAAA